MNKYQRINQGVDLLFEFSSLKFLFVMYAFMCVWSKTVLESILTLSLFIEYVSGFDLRSVYSYQSMPNVDVYSLIFTVPLLETLIFQSVVQNLIRRTTDSTKWSIFIATSLFALTHAPVNVAYAINAFGLGLALATIYEYFRVHKNHLMAFKITFGIHAFWNGILAYGLFPDKLLS
ncbi:CPBP family intramembrane glutamic endopeptidase [Vibrio alginolyticus]